MLSTENLVVPGSDYYIYTPSAQAQSLFLYPLIVGRFQYLPGYHLRRNALDSFLVMYVVRGGCEVECGGKRVRAREGQVVVLDCYAPHAYHTAVGWEAEWLHFDGLWTRGYFDAILAEGGPVISLKNSYRFEKYLHKIYVQFQQNAPGAQSSGIIEDSIAYINDHLTQELSLEDLAAKAALSPFYFSRLFKKETGFSPHQYILATRISNAKFLLQSTGDSVKNICFTVGFTSESSFCTAFKKETGLTPSEFRRQVRE